MYRTILAIIAAIACVAVMLIPSISSAATGWKYPAPAFAVVSHITTNGYEVSWNGVTGPSGQKPATYTAETFNSSSKVLSKVSVNVAHVFETGLAKGKYTTRVWANGGPLAPPGSNVVATIYGYSSSSALNGGLQNTAGLYEPGEIYNSNSYNTYVIQDMWGVGNGMAGVSQTTEGYNPSDWSVVANMPKGNGAVLTYPDVQQLYTNSKDKNPPLTSFGLIVSNFALTMPNNSGTIGEAGYDIWTNYADDIMIWVNTDNEPIGNWDQYLGTATFYGQTFKLYRNGTKAGDELIWLLQSNENSGSIHILAMLNKLTAMGLTSPTNGLAQIDFGWELCSTGGVPETFHISNYTLQTAPADGSGG